MTNGRPVMSVATGRRMAPPARWRVMPLAPGVVLGIAQAIGAQISPGWQLLAGHLVFFAVLAVRPRGLFPRMD